MNVRWAGLSAVVYLVFASLVLGAVSHNTIRPERVISGLAGWGDGAWRICPMESVWSRDCYDKNVRIWDIASGKLLRTFEGHTGPIRGVAVSRDGKWIASASADRTVRVWDAASGDQIAQLEGHALQRGALSFGRMGPCSAAAARECGCGM